MRQRSGVTLEANREIAYGPASWWLPDSSEESQPVDFSIMVALIGMITEEDEDD